MNMTLANVLSLTDHTALGLFDTDGSVLICIDQRQPRFPPFYLRIIYCLELSNSKRDLVQKFAESFGGQLAPSQSIASFRANADSPVGMVVRDFLLRNNPLHPGRSHDFLLSEEIRVLFQQNKQTTREGLVTLITLAYNNKVSEQTPKGSRNIPIENWYRWINATEAEFIKGFANANSILSVVRSQVSALERNLPTMRLSTNYVRGAHFGDGGFTVGLSWDPVNRRRTEFSWNISDGNKMYCEAFKNTFGGYVNKTGKNCWSFKLAGTNFVRSVYFIFEETWLPAYKEEQFSRFRDAIALIKDKRHMTMEGTIEVLDLVYDMSEKGKRKYSKEELFQRGRQWLQSRGFI